MENIANNLDVQSESVSTESTSDVVAFDYQSNVWVISDEISDKTLEINFTERFNPESEWQISVAKADIYDRCIEFDGTIKTKTKVNTVRSHLGNMTTVFDNCHRYYGDKLLSEYTEYELLKVVTYHRGEDRIKTYRTVQFSVTLINALWNLRMSNHLSDQDYLPTLKLSERWPELVVEHFAPEGFNKADWMYGGSYDIVPFEVSLAVLTYCIEILRSDELKYLLAWYDMLRKHSGTEDYIREGAAYQMLSNFGGEYAHQAALAKRYDQEYLERLKHYFPDVETHADLPLNEIPFTYETDGGVYPRNHVLSLTKFYRNACKLRVKRQSPREAT